MDTNLNGMEVVNTKKKTERKDNRSHDAKFLGCHQQGNENRACNQKLFGFDQHKLHIKVTHFSFQLHGVLLKINNLHFKSFLTRH